MLFISRFQDVKDLNVSKSKYGYEMNKGSLSEKLRIYIDEHRHVNAWQHQYW